MSSYFTYTTQHTFIQRDRDYQPHLAFEALRIIHDTHTMTRHNVPRDAQTV